MGDRSATTTWHVNVAGVEHVVSLGGSTDGLPDGVVVLVDGQAVPQRFVARWRRPGVGQGEWQFEVGGRPAVIYRHLIDLQIPLYALEVDGQPVAPPRRSAAAMARPARPLIAGLVLLAIVVALVWGVLTLAAR